MTIAEQGNWGAAKKFRLILRESGQTREMGGNEMSLAVGIVDNIMMQALESKTSDIHLQPERDQLKIRFRQDGVLTETGFLPPEQAANVLARLKLAAGMRIDETREPQDGRIDMELDNRRLSARASCVPCLNGEKFVMRLLDPQSMKVWGTWPAKEWLNHPLCSSGTPSSLARTVARGVRQSPPPSDLLVVLLETGQLRSLSCAD